MKLTHLDDEGRARMVDVGDKPATARRARAEGIVSFGEDSFRALAENKLAKGDALTVARLAGIQAAKRTDEWIPLCHTIPLDGLEMELTLVQETRSVRVVAEAATRGSTGVEMEALVAVSAACLTLYDMAKALDRGIEIGPVRLLAKSGGRSGSWVREGG